MDASTLALNRKLLRLLRGALGCYETWINEQSATVMTEKLKAKKQALSRDGFEATEETK